ncbi:TPA: hypothetical protein ACFN7T_002128, partial [Neisseria meningitidis]
ISFPKFQHNRNLTVAVATEPLFPPLFVIPAKAGIQNLGLSDNLRPLQNSPKSPKFPPRHLGDFS